ncbi:glycosyltransferase [Algisphaera agarilytica]|uniref:Cellulose synthase/poly-beta-1,6-N-acetylglucosamine synthase-like glycosyltransferase n=1 Tax=Algisphaera agarilytica TaxID=1385975 RepID=A0A7X0H5H6_9BACT|nr:glycosyltransferase [Algisphaera agarilytica]MBB6429657.1 cellulose synthase/poly-beta-1,6-N-acetylglucosamine synthase-like glycosyltransferase [Algisphaera agarilytica]
MLVWLPILLSGVAGLAALVWAYINYGGFGKSLRYQLPQPGDPESEDTHQHAQALPGVALLSPGRDEADHLPTVIPEWCEQEYPNLRVVFIDDASTDDTPTITAELSERYPKLLVVRNEQEPPPGWMGKCWAVHRGYEALQSELRNQQSDIEWLCFTDADIHWHPRLLRTAIEHAQEHDADLLGVTPTLRFGSAGEAIVQLQLVLALGLMLPFEKAMDPDSPVALTGGAFILVRKKFYDDIGGHTAVKGEMVEDLKIGAALKAAGARHRVATAGELQWCRMYNGWADMWEGLTKNAYAGLGHKWWAAAGVILATLLLNVGPVLYVLASALWLAVVPGWLPGVTLVVSLLTVAWQARALNAGRKLMSMPWPYAWTLPIGSAIYALIIAASVWQYHTKGNAWKGRRYSSAHAGA